MGILFGPVPSRRLGRSLGVDMVPYKTCSFNCLYCELGQTTCHTLRRQSFLDPDLVMDELKDRLIQLRGELDYITLAGSGEPMLNADLGDLVSRIKSMTDIPLALLTNSSLLKDPGLRKEILDIDLIVPSLDAVTQKVFEQINQPVEGIQAEEILESLIALRKELKGRIWLEILFCRGINDSPTEVDRLHKAVQAIRPDLIQINTVVRPPAIEGTLPCSDEELQQIAGIFGFKAEVIGQHHPGRGEVSQSRSLRKRVLELIKRRPCTLEDIVLAVGVSRVVLIKALDDLIQSDLLQTRSHDGHIYYQARSD